MSGEAAPRPFIFVRPPSPPDALRAAIRRAYRVDETARVEALLAQAELAPEARERVAARARELVAKVRAGRRGIGGLDVFLHEYGLTSQEGVVLMCLAEALLRIPDNETADVPRGGASAYSR